MSAGTLQAGSATAFSANSDFTVTSALDLDSFSNTVGSLAGTGTVTNSAAATSVTVTAGGDNSSTTFGGTMINGAGTVGLTKTGTGTLTLTGANTYTGGTTISAGTLQIGSGGAGGSMTGNVLDQGTLAFDRSDTLTFAGNVSGTGTLSQMGVGLITLSGNSTYSGVTTVSAGTLLAGSITGLSTSSAFTVNSALDLNGFSSRVGSLAGSGTVTNNGGISAILTAGVDNTTTVFSGTLTDGTSNSLQLNKNGTGTMTLSGTNTYSGGTVFNGGILAVSSDSNLGTGSLKFSGGTLELLAGMTSSKAITLKSDGGGGTILTDTGTTSTFSGAISNVGGLTKTGAGVLILSGNNNYSGVTTVSAGTLQAGSTTGFSTNSAFTVTSALDLNGFSNNVGSLAGGGSVTNNGGTLATLTAGVDDTTTVFSGTLTDGTSSLQLNKTGTGMMTLSGANTYSGATIFNDGVLAVSSDSNLGTGSLKFAGGTLEVLAGNGGITSSKAIVLRAEGGTILADAGTTSTFSGAISNGISEIGAFTKNGVGTLILSGNNTYSGVTTLSAGTLLAGSTTALSSSSAFTVNSVLDLNGFSNTVASLAGSGTVTNGGSLNQAIVSPLTPTGTPATLTAGGDGTSTVFSGTLIDGTSSLGLTKTGVGTLTLTGANTYTGGTTVTAGTLQIGNGAGTGSIAGNVIDNAVLVVNRTGTLTLAGVVSGTGNLSQTGTGTLVLTGISTYTGTTSVSAGTLQVDGGLGNTALTVQSGATLAGQGTITGSVTILDGGHLAPGPAAQTLSVGNLALNTGSILDYQLSTPGVIGSGVNTLVNVTGNLTLDGVLNVTNGGSFGSGSYRLLNYTGALTDLTLGLGTLPTGFSSANVTVITAVAGQVNLVVNGAGAPTQFWDGSHTVFDSTVHGGTGTWDNFTTNFTNGTAAPNQAWQNGVAVFSAAAGTVTLGADILFQGIQFSIDGYTVAGAGAFALHPTGTAMITTDSGVTATISAPIAGTGGLNKAGLGLLTLSGENTYSGGTTVSGGTLSVGSDTDLGDSSGGVTLHGGELENNANFTTARTVAIVSGNGANILAAAASTTATYTGLISGAGGLTVGDGTHLGTVVLTNVSNSYTGGTTVSVATLSVAHDANLGDLSGGVTLDGGELVAANGFSTSRTVALTANGGTLAATAAGKAIFSGNLTGAGNLTIGDAVNTGTVALGGTNTYLGSTIIASGATLQALSATALSPTSALTVTGTLDVHGFANEIGSLAGSGTVTNGGSTGAVLTTGAANSSTLFSGNLEDGTAGLGLSKAGTGALKLSGADSYSGATTVTAGTLQAGSLTAFSSNSAFTVNGVLDLHGFSNAVGSLAGSGTVTNSGGPGPVIIVSPLGSGLPATLTVGSDGTSTLFSGTLMSGTSPQIAVEPLANGNTTLALTKTGVGTLTLTGTNTYTGGTTFNGGTVAVDSDSNLGTGALKFNGGALEALSVGGGITSSKTVTLLGGGGTFIGDTTTASTLNGVISGVGSLTKSGAGALVLSAAETYSGGTAISAGVLALGNGGATGSIVGNVTDNGTLVFNRSDNITFGGIVSGTGILSQIGPGTLTLTGVNTFSGGTKVGSNSVLSVESDTELGDAGGGITLQGGEIETSATFSSARAISTLIPGVAGGNILAAATATTATYSGIVSGSGGLVIGSSGDAGTVVLSNVNNSYTGGTTISGATLSVTSHANLGDGNGGLTLDGGELLVANGFSTARTVALTANGGTLSVGAAGDGLFSGNITGTGGLTIGDAVNTGVVSLGGTDTYLGNTTIVSGATLRTFSETALSPASALIVQGTLDVNGYPNEVGSLAGGGTVTNGDTFDAVLTAGGDNSSTAFSGVLEDGTDPLGLTKVGSGTLELSGTSTYSDPTTVSAGTLAAGSVTALSPNSAFTVNGVLDLGGFSNTVGSLAGNGTVTNGGLPVNGIGPLGNPIVGPAVLTAGGDGTSTIFSGTLRNGAGTLGLGKTGGGTLTLTGTNTYTGGTTITAGILQIGSGAASGSIVGDVVDNAALVFNRSDTITFAGVVSGTGNLSQAGAGTLILTGTSTYTGTTSVAAGTLQVDGGLGNTAVTVQSGATLAGQGTIGGNVTIQDGAHLAPGPGAETLGVGTLVLNPAAILDYQLSNPGVVGSGVNSLVNVTGNLTLDGVLNVSNGGNFGSGFYRLLNYTGALTNNTLDLGTLPTGFSSANVTVTTAVAGQVNLVVNASGAPTQFWDGSNTVNDLTAHGGNGTWDNFTTNFTNVAGTVNEAWQNGIAIFAATWGTVTLGSDILYQGMTFVSSDYAVVGDVSGSFALHPTGVAMITTDSGVMATIAAPIVGLGGVNKAGPGLLILTGVNTYSGGTTVSGGTLSVSSDTNLGDPSIGVTLDGGELLTSATFTTPRTVASDSSQRCQHPGRGGQHHGDLHGGHLRRKRPDGGRSQ